MYVANDGRMQVFNPGKYQNSWYPGSNGNMFVQIRLPVIDVGGGHNIQILNNMLFVLGLLE